MTTKISLHQLEWHLKDDQSVYYLSQARTKKELTGKPDLTDG